MNVAFCFRTPQKLLVVYEDLIGKVQIHSYSELLAKPYVKEVFAKSFENPPQHIVKIATDYVEELQKQKPKEISSFGLIH